MCLVVDCTDHVVYLLLFVEPFVCEFLKKISLDFLWLRFVVYMQIRFGLVYFPLIYPTSK
jgi:hypothetical protein